MAGSQLPVPKKRHTLDPQPVFTSRHWSSESCGTRIGKLAAEEPGPVIVGDGGRFMQLRPGPPVTHLGPVDVGLPLGGPVFFSVGDATAGPRRRPVSVRALCPEVASGRLRNSSCERERWPRVRGQNGRETLRNIHPGNVLFWRRSVAEPREGCRM